MTSILYVLSATLRILLYAFQLLMLARAIVSWLPLDEDSPVENFLYAVTEPVIAPVRALCERFGWFEGLPVDMSFFITFLLITVLTAFL
ncbi:MAG: YggT family protein [Clostridia bacterium]|nr:YggT family protein [Clostridia bacterium]MBQ3814979.1 YggT family protein [Clostridia bacterium]MBR4186116.1 YggT family protein [Clostridia bacterium]